MLRILKYKPPLQLTEVFRQGLVEGDKQVIYPVLEWILNNITELKQIAYLARYLVKLEIPPEISADQDVAEIYEQYEDLIDQFKTVHKECDAIKNSGYSTSELRKDIEEMEREKEIVQKRIERMQRKVEGMPNLDVMLEVAKKLRQEKERNREIKSQKQDQRNNINHSQQRIMRLEQQLTDMRQAGIGTTPEVLLQKLEEEAKVNAYIVMEKLPRELEQKKHAVTSLEKVLNQPALTQGDLQELKKRITDANTEAKEISDKKNVSSDPMEDKLTLFRQQAAIITRKKETTAERLNDARSALSAAEDEVRDKKGQIGSLGGEVILKGDDFKKYVNALRTKSNDYKTKRQQLSELKSEYGVLARTLEVISSRNDNLNESLSAMEASKGITGFRDTQGNLEKVANLKANLDEQKGSTLEDMSGLVHQLTVKIAERKSRLAPIIKELRPLRQQCQDMQMSYDEKKHYYDSTALQLQSNMGKLESGVRGLRDEILGSETKFHLLSSQKTVLDTWHERVTEEMKLYVSNKPEDKHKSLRERFLKSLNDGEKRSKMLKDEQKAVREAVNDNVKQTKMWGDLEKLFECKKKCLDEAMRGEGGTVHRGLGSETLVL